MTTSSSSKVNREGARQQSSIPKEVSDENESQDMSISFQDLLSNVTNKNDAVHHDNNNNINRGKGKRKVVVQEAVVDKATLQKQRRMIKNRESAARSRERKQAYTVELEFIVSTLQGENAELLKEEEDRRRQRFNQLMECIIPVEERRKPKQMLRRVNSVQW